MRTCPQQLPTSSASHRAGRSRSLATARWAFVAGSATPAGRAAAPRVLCLLHARTPTPTPTHTDARTRRAAPSPWRPFRASPSSRAPSASTWSWPQLCMPSTWSRPCWCSSCGRPTGAWQARGVHSANRMAKASQWVQRANRMAQANGGELTRAWCPARRSVVFSYVPPQVGGRRVRLYTAGGAAGACGHTVCGTWCATWHRGRAACRVLRPLRCTPLTLHVPCASHVHAARRSMRSWGRTRRSCS